MALIAEERQRAAQEARYELLMHMENAQEGKKQSTLMSFFRSAVPCLPQLPTPKDYCSNKGFKTYSMCVYVYVINNAYTHIRYVFWMMRQKAYATEERGNFAERRKGLYVYIYIYIYICIYIYVYICMLARVYIYIYIY